jgi:predicted permease
MRQLFTESLLIALLGSAAGLAVGYFLLRGMMAWTDSPPWLNPAPDWRVVVFAVSVGFAAAILFGLTPAVQIARQRHQAAFIRQVLVGAQVAASCILLIVAGLLVRALDRAMTTHPGFAYERVVSIDPSLSTHGYSAVNAQAYLNDVQNRLRRLPGVESVSLSDPPPLGHKTVTLGVEINGRSVEILTNRIDTEFLETMKIPMLKGRNLIEGDEHALIVSKSLAELKWPSEDPIGKPFPIDNMQYTVVGVVGNARLVALENSDALEMFQLAKMDEMPGMVVVARTSGRPEGSIPFFVSAAQAVDPKLFPEIQLLKYRYQEKVESAEYSALCASLLGFTALLVACVGIVGIVSYSVSQRIKEIGIRMALGAKPSHVLLAVLSQLSRPVIAGLLIGVGGAAMLSRILRQMLYGVSNLDPIAYLSTIGLFVFAVGIAGIVPARRALRVDPMFALRHE